MTKEQLVVGVVYGGTNAEHDTNHSSAGLVTTALLEDNQVRVIKQCKDGSWRWTPLLTDTRSIDTDTIENDHLGAKNSLKEATSALKQVDVAFLTIPGRFTEDGRLQGLLDLLNTPYTFSNVKASAISMHKPTTYQSLHDTSVNPPDWAVTTEDEPVNVEPPYVVKPVNEGASIGVKHIKTRDALHAHLQRTNHSILIQHYIDGVEVTCGVLNDPEPTSLPVTELKSDRAVLTEEAKDKHRFTSTTPADLPKKQRRRIQRLSRTAHEHLGCRGATRSDFIVADKPYYLETNTIPGLTDKSALPEGARAAGHTYHDLINTILNEAARRPR